MRVKICGITNLEDAIAAIEAGADALGFNFAEEAKRKNRYIAPERARTMIAQLPPFVTTVAVTVNASPQTIRDYLEFVDAVQLHGEESPELCAQFAGHAIKAFRAGSTFRPETMVQWPARAYLLDALVPGERGGTGKTGDWNVAAMAVSLGVPVILAGGLTPDNVADAVRAVRPSAVDAAGGVESEPGKKDHERVRDFIRNAKIPLS